MLCPPHVQILAERVASYLGAAPIRAKRQTRRQRDSRYLRIIPTFRRPRELGEAIGGGAARTGFPWNIRSG
jgi:hypothetical protein